MGQEGICINVRACRLLRHLKIYCSKFKVDAVKNLMRQEILMMRKVHKDTAECWVCGVAEVTDIASAEGLKMMFGAKEDKSWLKKQGQIFIEVS